MNDNSLPEYVDLLKEIKKEDRISTANRNVFESLVTPLMNSLYNTALRMTYNQDNAKNLARDTIYKAFRNFNQHDNNTNFKVWAFSIMVNTYVTAYRNTIQQPEKEIADKEKEFYFYDKIKRYLNSDSTDMDDILDRIHENDIKTALENLPSQLRLLVILCDIEGFSYTDIAIIINAPMRNITSQLYQGRKLLQRNLWNYSEKKSYVLDEKE
jgi:RNA polymerase sigma-70 factor, ECF subfamily